MSRPALELADIFRRYGAVYRQTHALPKEQLRLMRAIEICRTAALGGHVETCGQCKYTRIAYNSCRNRHCPKCQSLDRARWLANRKADLLPVEYFHVVFTVPEPIAGIALQNKSLLYGILFAAAAETLLTIARDPRHLGADIGFFAILHSWGQNLLFHPHLHCVVAGGGIGPDQQWVACRPGFFLPVRVLSRLFRRLFLQALQKAFGKGKLRFHSTLAHLNHPKTFEDTLSLLSKSEWVVYAKPPFGGPQQVLEYLGRYTHRVALSNDRLVAIGNQTVSFQWKDYRQRHRSKVMTLTAEEFLRRFLLHSLPPGFQRIRHYGFLSNRHRKQAVDLCRRLLSTPCSEFLPQPAKDSPEVHEALTGILLKLCPNCRIGTLFVTEVLPAQRYSSKPALDSS